MAGTMVPGPSTYWVPRGPSPVPPGKQPITSSEEDPDDRSTTGGHGGLPLCFTHFVYLDNYTLNMETFTHCPLSQENTQRSISFLLLVGVYTKSVTCLTDS